jgi:hypothetical protein
MFVASNYMHFSLGIFCDGCACGDTCYQKLPLSLLVRHSSKHLFIICSDTGGRARACGGGVTVGSFRNMYKLKGIEWATGRKFGGSEKFI